jgi:protein SCO1/2
MPPDHTTSVMLRHPGFAPDPTARSVAGPSPPRRGPRLMMTMVALAVLATACSRHHETTGVILRVDRPGEAVTISHEAFPGFMDAMVMSFDLQGQAAAQPLGPGDRVRFRLAVRGERSWVDSIDVLSAARTDAGLQRTPAVPALVPLGEPIPDFTLINQHGEPVTLSSLHRSVVAVSFVYTRCPLPDYCPRILENLRQVASRYAGRMGKDLALLVITFDPKYDTPERLAAYARQQRADGPGWYFLTGSAADIERVCDAFGVEYWPEEGLITHSLQTAVIDRDGRLAATVEGREYSGRQLTDLVGAILEP